MTAGSSDDSLYSSMSSGKGTSYLSRSNPDLSSLSLEDSVSGAMHLKVGLGPHGCLARGEHPEHVLKIYKSDQRCKYLIINKVKK